MISALKTDRGLALPDLINGAYDEVDQSATLPFFKAIPKVKWFVFAESSHTPHFEEREKYMKMVSEFLTE